MKQFIATVAFVLGMSSQEPLYQKEVPHHNLNREQTRFVLSHAQKEEAGIFSLNSKGLHFYEKKDQAYADASHVLSLETRAEDRHWLGVGDFDNDDKEDIAYVVNHTLSVHQNGSDTKIPSYLTAHFVWQIPHQKTADEQGVVRDRESGFVADLNNDGLDDIVLANATGCYVFSNATKFSFTDSIITFPHANGEWGYEPYAFDWDGDGKKDIVLGTSQGVFVSYNTKNGFTNPEKIASVQIPKTSADVNNFITNSSERNYPSIPHANWNDTLVLKTGTIEGKETLVAGTYYGFFTLTPEKINRLLLSDETNNFLPHLRSTGDHDHPDFIINGDKIIYATKAGYFTAVLQNGFYMQSSAERVIDGGVYDRAFLLPVISGHAVGTSRYLSFY